MAQHESQVYPICPIGSRTSIDETVTVHGQDPTAQAPVYTKGNLWAVQPTGKTNTGNKLQDNPSLSHNCEVFIHGKVVASEGTLVEQGAAGYVDRGDDNVDGATYVTYTIRCIGGS